MVKLAQEAALASNVPHNFVESSKAIAAVIQHAVASDFSRVELTKEAEAAWVNDLIANSVALAREDCTPGYNNNEGRPRNRRTG